MIRQSPSVLALITSSAHRTISTSLLFHFLISRLTFQLRLVPESGPLFMLNEQLIAFLLPFLLDVLLLVQGQLCGELLTLCSIFIQVFFLHLVLIYVDLKLKFLLFSLEQSYIPSLSSSFLINLALSLLLMWLLLSI